MSTHYSGTSSSTYYSGTSSSTAYAYSMYMDVNKATKDKSKPSRKFNSKILEKIMMANMLGGNVSIFADRKSPAFKDQAMLGNEYGLDTYYNDPVTKGFDAPTSLRSYSHSLIIDALEYMPSVMVRANTIKEALATLARRGGDPHVLVVAKSKKEVHKLANDRGYEAAGEGFLIPLKSKYGNELFGGHVIRGLDVNDLVEAAHFAGVTSINTDQIININESLIRIYLNEQA